MSEETINYLTARLQSEADNTTAKQTELNTQIADAQADNDGGRVLWLQAALNAEKEHYAYIASLLQKALDTAQQE